MSRFSYGEAARGGFPSADPTAGPTRTASVAGLGYLRRYARDIERGVNDAVLSERLQARRPVRRGPAPIGRPADRPPTRGGRRADRRVRPGRSGPGRAVGQLPRHHDGRHRPQGRSARDRPGRRGGLPHRRDVRGVRPGRSAHPRGLPGQRGQLLAAGPRGPDADHPHRAHRRRRGGPVRDAARDRQPGADARLPARSHGAFGEPVQAVLRPAGHGHPDRHQRLVRPPGDGHRGAPQGVRGDGGDLDGPGPLRRRL